MEALVDVDAKSHKPMHKQTWALSRFPFARTKGHRQRIVKLLAPSRYGLLMY